MKRIRTYLKTALCLTSAALMLAASGLQAAADGVIFPGGVQSSAGESADGVWSYNDYGNGTVSVVCLDKTIVNAEIPETIDGRTINMVEANCFLNNASLETVVLPDTIEYIEEYAFYGCSSLKEIKLHNGITQIGYMAFYGCESLTEMMIPASVELIDKVAFSGCSGIPEFVVSDANAHYKAVDGVLFDSAGTTLMQYPPAKSDVSYDVPDGCTMIDVWAFIGNASLKEVNLEGVTQIGEQAFYYCQALESVTIPEGITKLEPALFGQCTALKSVTLPSTLATISENCFYNCVMLSELTLPASTTTIGANAFLNCASLKQLTLGPTVTTIGNYALGYYYDENEQLQRLPNFVIDAKDGTAGFTYALENDLKCTGGVTQSIVFVYVMIGVVVLVIGCTIALIIVQRRINKRYELR